MVNGGNEVYRTLLEKNIPHTHVRICGVYADACVQETVLDLSKRIPDSQIHLVRNGIASCGNHPERTDGAIKDMTFFHNIKVLD
jgi:nicotinamidase-related amidase